jgi:hypothetical protein
MSGFTNLILFIPVFIDWRIALMTVAPQLINNPALNGGDLEILLPTVISHVPVGIKGLLLQDY